MFRSLLVSCTVSNEREFIVFFGFIVSAFFGAPFDVWNLLLHAQNEKKCAIRMIRSWHTRRFFGRVHSLVFCPNVCTRTFFNALRETGSHKEKSARKMRTRNREGSLWGASSAPAFERLAAKSRLQARELWRQCKLRWRWEAPVRYQSGSWGRSAARERCFAIPKSPNCGFLQLAV